MNLAVSYNRAEAIHDTLLAAQIFPRKRHLAHTPRNAPEVNLSRSYGSGPFSLRSQAFWAVEQLARPHYVRTNLGESLISVDAALAINQQSVSGYGLGAPPGRPWSSQ